MAQVLLKDATLVTPQGIIQSDLLCDGGRIAKIAPQLSAPGTPVLDCHELLALPGMIDEHVHFRDPGFPAKATLASESRAALLGGVTSFMDMPNTDPPTVSMTRLLEKKAKAAQQSVANYAFYLGASGDNCEELKKAPPREIAGIKIYMGATTGSLLVEDYERLLEAFKAAPTLIALHCEDSALIAAQERRVKNLYGDEPEMALHALIRGRDCCLNSTKLAIALAKESGARIHILHISTQEEVTLLSEYLYGNAATRQISGEAALPHLFFSAADYARKGGLLKCNPSVKNEADRRALVTAVERGVLTTVGTDHAPHEAALKAQSYFKCPSGCTSVQFAWPALLALWKRRELTLESAVKACAQQVAERYRIQDRGRLEEGCYADIVLVNPALPQSVDRYDLKSLCGCSVFEGEFLPARVVHTLVNGVIKVKDGTLCSEESGQALYFARD